MKPLLGIVILFSCCLPAHAANTVLECARLIDVEQGKVLQDRKILIEGGRIKSLGKEDYSELKVQRIKLDTCLPGLMDMHVHLDGQREIPVMAITRPLH